jgi:cysteine desulfurase
MHLSILITMLLPSRPRCGRSDAAIYAAPLREDPSSTHAYGRATKKRWRTPAPRVAALLGCAAPEVVFTSGGSESNNTVLKGVAYTYRHQGHHIITSAVEHPATINPCRFLEQQGLRVTYLPVDRTGMGRP